MKKITSIIRTSLICLLAIVSMTLNFSVVAKATEGETTVVTSNGIPAIIEVASYSVDGGVIEAGKDITINLELHNTSSNANANSVMLTLSSTSGMAYPVYGSSNQIYVGTISAGDTTVVSIPVSVSNKFTGSVLDLTVKLDYETKGSKATNTSTMVIPTSAGNTLYVKSLNVSSHAILNGNSLLTISYSNLGGTDISGAKLVIDGNISSDSKTIELGTIYAGKSYSRDYHLTFTQSGSQQISVKLVYPGDEGENIETELGTYSVNVVEQQAGDTSDGSGNLVLVWVGRGIAALALLAAAGVVITYIRKR